MKNVTIPNNFYTKYQERISVSQKLIRWMNWSKIRDKIYKRYGIQDKWLHELEDHVLEDLINELLNYYKK